MAPTSTKSRKGVLNDTSNARIDSYFKPCPSPIKRKLENDENAPFNDESRKKTPSSLSLQTLKQEPLKRHFGDIKLNDENAKKKPTEYQKEEPAKRQFGEMKNMDENRKKTPCSSNSEEPKQNPSKRFIDDNKHNDENRKNTPSPSSSQQLEQDSLKRQFGDINSSAYMALRLPLMDKSPKTPLKSQAPKSKSSAAASKRVPAFAVLCDEDIEKGVEKAPTPPSVSRVFRDSQDSQDTEEAKELNNELDTQFIQEGDINNTQWTEVTSSPISVFAGDDDYQDTQDLPPVTVYNDKGDITEKDKENKVSPNNKENQHDDEYSDGEGDSDLFPKTNDAVISFKPVTIGHLAPTSYNASQFFSDGEEETRGESTLSFFDDEEEDNQELLPDNTDMGFSVAVNGENASPVDRLSLDLDQPTLTPESFDAVSEIHVAYKNPRGKDLWEKLGIEKNNNENENEDPESDNLPW